MKTICVYCGSKPGADPVYTVAARSLARAMTDRGIGLVYGGASIGLMGTMADAVLAGGCTVTGVIPGALFKREVAHQGLTEIIEVGSMHQRKEKMASLCDGFIALPGGFGTLEELFEAITWCQLRIHTKPIGLLNVSGYYDQLADFIDHAVDQGFIRPAHQSLYTMDSDADTLIGKMENLLLKM
jgi:uncharacterized protein (TIGR00730 family)